MYKIKERTDYENLKFRPGDRVQYPEKIFNYIYGDPNDPEHGAEKNPEEFKIKFGVVKRVISQTDTIFGVGSFDEMYEVLWDDGSKQTFLAQALLFEDESRNPKPEEKKENELEQEHTEQLPAGQTNTKSSRC